MRKLAATIRSFQSDERGASLLEYSVMLAGIAVMALLAVRAFGGSTQRSLQQSAAMVTEALGGESSGGPGGAASAGPSPSGSGSPSLPGVSGSSGSGSGGSDAGPGLSGSGGTPPGGGNGGHGNGGGAVSVGS